MSPLVDAFARSWPSERWLWTALALSAAVYVRGWIALGGGAPRRFGPRRLASFLGGLAAIFLAVGSPIEPFAGLLLWVHMLQHMLLLLVAPPLVWLAAPLVPMLRGLPRGVRTVWVAPVLRSPVMREVFGGLTHPAVAWLAFVAVVWVWHAPRMYELALDRAGWHVAEHASFVAAGLLFWYPVVRPYPSRPAWSRWLVPPYLILADVQNTILSAWLAFSSRPIYAHYAEVPRVGGWSALADQQAAGVLMWVPGSIAFLVPVCWIGLKMLYREGRSPRAAPVKRVTGVALPVIHGGGSGCAHAAPARRAAAPRWDLLEVPLVGRWLQHPHARPAMQIVMLVLAALVIVDGLTGPNLAPANLAGVAPWIHWRGLVMLGLLVGGNFFCMACPFTLPRKLAAQWLPAGWAWPRWLRTKWLAVALVAAFFWSYEALALWNNPWLTAWIAIGYFAAAFAVDGLFRGTAFCKYVCPIGQFNFVQSLVSPLEVAVREPQVCAGCRTHECLRGSATVSGCGMGLFQPRKRGNLDCTFCLDCVRACPHENVGVLATLGSGGLANVSAFRSGIGRLCRRGDVAVLVLVLVFGAFANAAGMVAPVVAWQDALGAWWGNPPMAVVTTAFYLLALVVAPAALVAAAALVSRAWGRLEGTPWRVAKRYAYALVPLGFAMWLAHHGFHLFTSYGTIVPVAARMAMDFGLNAAGEPQWQWACCAEVAPWIVRFELAALGCGLLWSLHAAYRIAEQETRGARQQAAAFVPWGCVAALLFAAGVWIVLAPMQMRGTLGG